MRNSRLQMLELELEVLHESAPNVLTASNEELHEHYNAVKELENEIAEILDAEIERFEEKGNG